jgi:cystathionine gamma-synthase
MPSSPHMYLIDVAQVRQIVGPDVIITLDSSFSPPPNFYALQWGVDLALFSATKYMGGHGDIVSGILSGRRDLIEQIRWYRDTSYVNGADEVIEDLDRALSRSCG